MVKQWLKNLTTRGRYTAIWEAKELGLKFIENKTLTGCTYDITGKLFFRCRFTDCDLLYTKQDFSFRKTLIDHCFLKEITSG